MKTRRLVLTAAFAAMTLIPLSGGAALADDPDPDIPICVFTPWGFVCVPPQ